MVTTIEGGRRFSEALQVFPEIFTSVYASMIRVGEESGQLDRILTDLTDMLRWHDELIAQTRTASSARVCHGISPPVSASRFVNWGTSSTISATTAGNTMTPVNVG